MNTFAGEEYLYIESSADDEVFHEEVILELKFALGDKGRVFIPWTVASRGGVSVSTFNQVLVALGSAGAFSAIYQLVSSFLNRNKDREVTLERQGVRIVLKGHSFLEEQELVRLLFASHEGNVAPGPDATAMAKAE